MKLNPYRDHDGKPLQGYEDLAIQWTFLNNDYNYCMGCSQPMKLWSTIIRNQQNKDERVMSRFCKSCDKLYIKKLKPVPIKPLHE